MGGVNSGDIKLRGGEDIINQVGSTEISNYSQILDIRGVNRDI